jgi:alanine racemase
MSSKKEVIGGPLLVGGSSDICGSVLNDIVVEMNCALHVCGNVKGSLTIERGANVVVEGSVDGRVVNRGGRLSIHNRGIAKFANTGGPAKAEVDSVLKINLWAIATNWEALAKGSAVESAAVVKANAYGCGADQVVATLSEVGCKTFFVSSLAEAQRVRAIAANSTIYVLNGLFPGTGPAFAALNARPVINSGLEMAEWEAFADSSEWTAGFALNVDTAAGRFGFSLEEAAAIAERHSPRRSVTVLTCLPDTVARPDQRLIERQIALLQDLRGRLASTPVSFACSSGISAGAKAHCDLAVLDAAIYGVNPTPDVRNPMSPVIELRARIIQVRDLPPGSWIGKRPKRLAFVCSDGYPLLGGASDTKSHGTKPQAIVDGQLCRIEGRASMHLLAVDVSNLKDPAAARRGEMVTLIGGQIGVDDLAAAVQSTGSEVLGNLTGRFHRLYYVG